MSESNPKRGLGRGLNALFDDNEEFGGDDLSYTPDANMSNQESSDKLSAALAGMNTDGAAANTQGTMAPTPAPTPVSTPKGAANLSVAELEPSQFQPRRTFDADALNELAESIKVHGLLQPIVVREKDLVEPGTASYEIIAGERRWRAAQLAQLHEVPVIIKDMTDLEALEIALIENLQREDLNPVEEAMGLKRLLKDYDYTQEQLAKSLGKSRSYIANMVRLLNLPEDVLSFVEAGDLSAGHARALITVPNAGEMAKQIVDDKLSVRDTEKLVSFVTNNSKSNDNGTESLPGVSRESSADLSNTMTNSSSKSVDTLALEKELSDIIGMRVEINSKDNKSGNVTIAWKSLDQLDTVIKTLMPDR